MFVTLTDATHGIPVLVNLERVLYAYRQRERPATVLVFGKVVGSGRAGSGRAERIHNVAVRVEETLDEIQRQRRMGGG